MDKQRIHFNNHTFVSQFGLYCGRTDSSPFPRFWITDDYGNLIPVRKRQIKIFIQDYYDLYC